MDSRILRIPLGQYRSKVANLNVGGEKRRTEIKLLLLSAYFSENKKSGISYECLYNHATKITPSGNYHNRTVNGKSRREKTHQRKHLLLTTGNKKYASAQQI